MLATHTIPIFLSLEPDDESARTVERFKQRVHELVGEQLYLSDPPHVTLYLAMFEDIDLIVDLARRCASSLTVEHAAICGWHTFLDDPLTGLHTLVLDFRKRDQDRLRTLQMEIIESVSTSRDAPATLDRMNGRWGVLSPVEREAACRWGFPFVDDGWHPHLTIASIRPADWPSIERTLLAERPAGTVTFPRLQVFQLIDRTPHLLTSVELGKAASRPRSQRASVPMMKLTETPPGKATSKSIATLKERITESIWSVVDRHEWITSATITGSFLTDQSIRSISDIDTVLVVDTLNQPRFQFLKDEFTGALEPVLNEYGLALRINPTLGPLKFNDDDTAVLHLMLYSAEAHRDHVLKSPFTCFDWQRSPAFRKRSLASVYPVFGLQPRHFISSRRGIQDYLHDFDRSVVSYRELLCDESGYTEARREVAMSPRDRYEYAYHVMRFLMHNLLKLVRRENDSLDGDSLVARFAEIFPKNLEVHAPLYLELRRRKHARDFNLPIPRLADRLREFVLDFESQFRDIFIESATRHLFFRHAPTRLNEPQGGQTRFVGRIDPDIEPFSADEFPQLVEVLTALQSGAVYASPLKRCRQTVETLSRAVAMPPVLRDARLLEIDYGRCDAKSVDEARQEWPELFAAWAQGADLRFPEGENSSDVWHRLSAFIEETLRSVPSNTAICTHNVVLRCLVGSGLGIPTRDWHRIRIPHLAPIGVVHTRHHGWFIDLDVDVEATLLADFMYKPEGSN